MLRETTTAIVCNLGVRLANEAADGLATSVGHTEMSRATVIIMTPTIPVIIPNIDSVQTICQTGF